MSATLQFGQCLLSRAGRRAMRRRPAPGFTLIELVLALSISAIMITVLFGGLVWAFEPGNRAGTVRRSFNTRAA